MSFHNSITIDKITELEFTDLSDFAHTFTDDEDGIARLIPKERLTSLNFMYCSSSKSYTVTFTWTSPSKDEEIADEIEKVFGTLKGCVITYHWS